MIERLKAGERVLPAFLGIRAVPNNSGDGLYIEEIVKESAAAEAGLNRGDRITGINDEDVGDIMILKTILNRFEAGKKIELRYIPDAQREEKKVTIVLGSAPRPKDVPSPMEPPKIR